MAASSALRRSELEPGAFVGVEQAAASLRARPGFAAAVRHSTLASLAFYDRAPEQSRACADISALSLGMLAIHLDANGGLHHRGLRALTGRGGMLSAGRATALLWRMRRLGFIAPDAEFARGKERSYKPLRAMIDAFRARDRIELEALAHIDDRALHVLARYDDDPSLFVRLNSLAIEEVVGAIARGERMELQPLGGVHYLAMGFLITIAIAAQAFDDGRATAEGPVTLSLSGLARRFEVSRAHVRRVVKVLETIGLQSDPSDRRRFVLTPAFRARFELYHGLIYAALLGLVVRL